MAPKLEVVLVEGALVLVGVLFDWDVLEVNGVETGVKGSTDTVGVSVANALTPDNTGEEFTLKQNI